MPDLSGIALPVWRNPVVLASSSPQDELDHYLDLLDARELLDGGKAGIDTVCLITGGWSKHELLDAGAAAVYESI
jgi:hypothetical protein